MEINLDDLKEAHNKIFNYLAEIGITKVIIPFEYYWQIDRNQRYDSYEEPKKFTLGQFSDDIAEIKQIASGEKYPVSYALNWLASVYTAISQEMPYNNNNNNPS